MNDTVLRVAAMLYGEAGMTLAMLYAAAYVMACRAELAGPGVGWDDLLGSYMGGWAWYKRAVARGTLLRDMDRMSVVLDSLYPRHDLPEQKAYRLAWLMVVGRFESRHIAFLAEYEAGLHLSGPLLYCMSQTDVDDNHWEDGDIVVPGPKGYALHLYREFPESKHGNLASNTP